LSVGVPCGTAVRLVLLRPAARGRAV